MTIPVVAKIYFCGGWKETGILRGVQQIVFEPLKAHGTLMTPQRNRLLRFQMPQMPAMLKPGYKTLLIGPLRILHMLLLAGCVDLEMLMVCGASSACFCKLQNYKSQQRGHTFCLLLCPFVSYLFPSPGNNRVSIMCRVLRLQS